MPQRPTSTKSLRSTHDGSRINTIVAVKLGE
jgi:hypothetical protein